MKNIVVNKLVCIVVFIVSFMWIIYSLLLNNVFYSRLKYSKILWYGACGNELFIIKSNISEYTPMNNSFGFSRIHEYDLWLYKYDINTKECLIKKIIQKKDKKNIIARGFIVSGKTIFICNVNGDKTCSILYDINNLKEIKRLNCFVENSKFFESNSYYISEGRETFLLWNGEDDVFVNKNDIKFMKNNNSNMINEKDSLSGMIKMSNNDSFFDKYVMTYNSSNGERDFVVDIYNYKKIDYTLFDHNTKVKIGSISSKDIGCDFVFDFYCCGETFYNVSKNDSDDGFVFFRYNFISGLAESIIFKDK